LPGATLAHDDRHMARALIEGVSFALKDGLSLIQALGVAPDSLFAVGGGARSDTWRHWLAAILDISLQRLEAEEGPAMGAALLAMVGAGIHQDVDQAIASAVRKDGAPTRPDSELASRYGQIYEHFTRLYPALASTGIWQGSEAT